MAAKKAIEMAKAGGGIGGGGESWRRRVWQRWQLARRLGEKIAIKLKPRAATRKACKSSAKSGLAAAKRRRLAQS